MSDILLAIYAVLFSLTSIFLLIYFRRLRDITLKYIGSRKMLEDIIFSFNKDLQKCEERIQGFIRTYEEKIAMENRGREEINALLADVKSRLEEISRYKEEISTKIEELKRRFEELSANYNEILKRISEIEAAGVKSVEREVDVARSISPPEKSKALSSLTATEMRVLEILAREGEKTASEIRERIGLTREHTARLLKNLYERGYLERRSDKIPFVYRLNKEVEEILKGGK